MRRQNHNKEISIHVNSYMQYDASIRLSAVQLCGSQYDTIGFRYKDKAHQ